jgi:low temperature requirement protein LtrA
MAQVFRRWWQAPRRVADRPSERRITFLELFYDLVYVVLVSTLAHALSLHPNGAGLRDFGVLFVIVWWAWLNGSLYHELHGNDDIRTRVFTFLQMFAVAGMAVFAHNATGDGYAGFALAYAIYQAILTYLWWRTGRHDPAHRPLSGPYSLAFLLATLLFGGSLLVVDTTRFYLWGIAMAISLLIPVALLALGRRRPGMRDQLDRAFAVTPSLAERFGLFTIIVLGEVIVGVVRGVAEHHELGWAVGGTAALGMLTAIGVWWTYFDFVSLRTPRAGRGRAVAWVYLHLLVTAGVAAMGAGVLNLVQDAGRAMGPTVRWLMVGSTSAALGGIFALMRTLTGTADDGHALRVAGWVVLAAGIAVIPLGVAAPAPIPLLGSLDLVLLAPVMAGLWTRSRTETREGSD